MGILQPDRIGKQLGKSIFAKNIEYHQTLGSTNTRLKDLAIAGAPEGTIVIAEEQTAGRGRMGRQWLSPGSVNLLFSVLLRPVLEVEDVFSLTMAFALAACEGVEHVSNLKALIKWPNDIYLNEKKLGGVLTEFSVKDQQAEYVIIGIGLNVNWNPGREESVLYDSTSIKYECGKDVDRQHLLVALLRVFEDYYNDIGVGKLRKTHEKWNQKSMLLKRFVEVEFGDGLIRGTVIRIDKKGALVIKDESGEEKRIRNGDVTVKKGIQ